MKIIKMILIVILSALMVVFAILFIGGSFEAMPTEEQIEKGRIAYGIITAACAIADTAFIISLARER